MYPRRLDLRSSLAKKSLLLLGPRQTGKSTLVRGLGDGTYFVDLAETDTFRELSAHPELLRQRLPPGTRTLVVDEAQKLPELFDEAQVLLDRDKGLRVVMTGSSARKLRRSGVNLLPGRVWRRHLFPLVSAELGAPRIDERVKRGSLPGILDSADFRAELRNYVGLYLEEEVRAEGLTRNIGAFGRFLTAAALLNARQLNYTNVSNDAGVPLNTVKSWFQVLYDTLLGFELEPYRRTRVRKPVATPKFYLFDLGVANELLGRFEIERRGELFGPAFEHLVFTELRAALEYLGSDLPLRFWRSQSGHEVDFMLGDAVAVEVKGKASVAPGDERGLRALAEEVPLKRKIIVCLEPARRVTAAGNEVVPAAEFFAELWSAGGLLG